MCPEPSLKSKHQFVFIAGLLSSETGITSAGAKSEKNKPKGGKAKDEKRAAMKEKKEAKAGGGATLFGKK